MYGPKTAVATIPQTADKSIAPHDQARFIEVVEIEVMSLHEGNIVRYKLSPSEYEAWYNTWQ